MPPTNHLTQLYAGLVRTAFIAVVATNACAQTPQARSVALPACPADGWGEPRSLKLPDGRPVYVETPSSVQLANGTALFSRATLVWESQRVFLTEGHAPDSFAGAILWRDSLSLIPLPTGVTFMLDPLAVSDGRGGAHVFWGTTAARDSAKRENLRTVTGVAYARFDGVRWGPVEQLLTATSLTWKRSGRDIAVHGDEVDLVTPGWTKIEGAEPLGTVLIRKRPDLTRVYWDNLRTFVGHVALVRSATGMLQTFLISTFDTDSAKGVYGLYLRGTRPEAPNNPVKLRLVRAFNNDSIGNWIKALHIGATLHLIWIEWPQTPSADGRRSGSVWHALSDDDGATFTFSKPLLLPEDTDVLEPVALGNHLLVALKEPATHTMQFVEWRASGWGPVQRPFREWSLSVPAFVGAGLDSVLLTWGQVTTGVVPVAPSYAAPSSRIATLRRRCLRGH